MSGAVLRCVVRREHEAVGVHPGTHPQLWTVTVKQARSKLAMWVHQIASAWSCTLTLVSSFDGDRGLAAEVGGGD